MKELIKDYKRRLETTAKMLKEIKEYDPFREQRLTTKASCYSKFVTELERIEKENKPCGRLGVMTCRHFANNDTGCFNCNKHYMQIELKEREQ